MKTLLAIAVMVGLALPVQAAKIEGKEIAQLRQISQSIGDMDKDLAINLLFDLLIKTSLGISNLPAATETIEVKDDLHAKTFATDGKSKSLALTLIHTHNFLCAARGDLNALFLQTKELTKRDVSELSTEPELFTGAIESLEKKEAAKDLRETRKEYSVDPGKPSDGGAIEAIGVKP